MGLHTIEIDDAQILTLADLAAQLAAARAWGWHEVATDLRSDAWDFHFKDAAGEHWMTLDGFAYDTPGCDGEPVQRIDFRAELAVELVWATDSATGHPLALVQGR